MKRFSFLVLLLAFLAVGCAHSPSPASSLAPSAASFQPQLVMVVSNSEQIPLKSPEMSGSGMRRDDRKTSMLRRREEEATIAVPPSP